MRSFSQFVGIFDNPNAEEKEGAVSSPSSSPMMAGSEILDGSSLMSLQLQLWEEIVLSSFSSSFLKKVSVPPTLSLSSTQTHGRSLGFH